MPLTILMAQNTYNTDRPATLKIDRARVLERNNPHVTEADILASLTVGNGHFATTVDMTGLQTFHNDYEGGVPLCAMSDWGWHSFPDTLHLQHHETQRTMYLGHDREEAYAVEYRGEGRGKAATDYFRVNPHRLNLGNIGFCFRDKVSGKSATMNDIKDINQTLNLFDGNIQSHFSVLDTPVKVTSAVRHDRDAFLFKATTPLFRKGKATIVFTLPSPTGKHADAASEWNSPHSHQSNIISQTSTAAIIRHTIDATTYYIRISWEGKATITHNQLHTFIINPKDSDIAVSVEYAEHKDSLLHTRLRFAEDLAAIRSFWNTWWYKGGMADFSLCTDPRAKELERRTVLSQYLTYINCANTTPPQETGLTYNSWFGRPHLEMTWWHMIDFSLWNRPEVMQRILEWYNTTALPEALKIAERQHFKGVRWMKMTDPWAGEAPSNVGSFLTWQQPHYIYMAEEMYRHHPSPETLSRYAHGVEATAEFLADFANSCSPHDGGMIKLFGQTSAQESMSKDFSYCHPLEQVYFVYGLTTAQRWHERQGLPRNAHWDDIINRMAPLPEHNGIYTAGEPKAPLLVGDSTTVNTTFDPYNYNDAPAPKQLTEEEFYQKCRTDHPAVLGACGMLPYYGLYDKAKMHKTLLWVMDNWNWSTTWGWDYGMTAMCAARLGDGENAIRALLIDQGKNTYLVSGHNYQEPRRLRLYLPGNGALLDAVAMMCAGWDGCPNIQNPGFPHNGQWNVKWEGLRKMQ